jgi:hypothetical protein
VFEPATLVIHFIALIMTAIMIFHIKSKYTAVGRKEIVLFFYMYTLDVLIEFLLVSGIIQSSSTIAVYVTALQVGLITSTVWCLLFNGLIGFQWFEDGTFLSLWTLRLSTLLVLAASGTVALFTFLNWYGFSSANPTALFIVGFVFNAIALVVYILLQIVLVLRTLEDRWPLGMFWFNSRGSFVCCFVFC